MLEIEHAGNAENDEKITNAEDADGADQQAAALS